MAFNKLLDDTRCYSSLKTVELRHMLEISRGYPTPKYQALLKEVIKADNLIDKMEMCIDLTNEDREFLVKFNKW